MSYQPEYIPQGGRGWYNISGFREGGDVAFPLMAYHTPPDHRRNVVKNVDRFSRILEKSLPILKRGQVEDREL
jgi:hypothetical protein